MPADSPFLLPYRRALAVILQDTRPLPIGEKPHTSKCPHRADYYYFKNTHPPEVTPDSYHLILSPVLPASALPVEPVKYRVPFPQLAYPNSGRRDTDPWENYFNRAAPSHFGCFFFFPFSFPANYQTTLPTHLAKAKGLLSYYFRALSWRFGK